MNLKLNVEELEEKIKVEKEALVKLEAKYEAEPDAAINVKTEFKISRKEDTIDRLVDRQNVLLDREAANGIEDKDKNAEEKEEGESCPECGGRLIFIGKDDKGEVDVYQCEQCEELFLDE